MGSNDSIHHNYQQLSISITLRKKIDSITPEYSTKPFIKQMPADLETTNSEKVNIICDNIFAEQIEFNIKDGIKYGKMKVL